MSCVLKGGLSRSWLDLAVVEMTLRVDVQPAPGLVVLVPASTVRRRIECCGPSL